MAEGDTIHRNARRIARVLADDPLLLAEAPSARSPLRLQNERLGALVGRRLECADAHGKHLFLRFEGELTLHCHQGMRGSWHFYAPDARWRKPRAAAWVHIATANAAAVEFDGTRLALRTEGELRVDAALRALGPDILSADFDEATGLAALRTRARPDAELGDALLDQTVIAGIGNIFKSEGCFAAQLGPWRRLGELTDVEAERAIEATAGLMREAVASGRMPRRIYRRAGLPCPRCGAPIRSRGQGDANRRTYWCAGCQS